MKEKKRNLGKWFFGMALLIVLGGALTSAFLIEEFGKYHHILA